MQADQQAQLAFHLTGIRRGGELHPIDDRTLRPALLAQYRDLTRLRYDFPVVLLRSGEDEPYTSLSSLIDGLIERTAAGREGERTRRHLLRLERAIRKALAEGRSGTLGKLWDLALAEDEELRRSLEAVRAKLDCNGQVVDCDAAFPARALVRAWRYAEERKAARFRADIERLAVKLREMLHADFMNSEAGMTADALRATVGSAHLNAFDFDRMSAMLRRTAAGYGLPHARRERLERALATLERQPFFPPAQGNDRHSPSGYSFVFASCADVAEAYRERLPLLLEVARAMAVAELEIRGEYNPVHHDALFAAYAERAPRQDELARFPSYLVCLYSGATEEYTELMGLLEAGVPVKALVQFDDLAEPSHLNHGRVALSLRAKQLADMAIGLNGVYVLQASASHLVQVRSALLKGLACDGPALFSIYSGATPGSSLSPYLAAAAAMEARVFPAFTYDPSAGPDWAARFSVALNPQPERDWPVQPFTYEDGEHQRMAENLDFTFVEFAACDPRYADHFARVEASACNGHLASVPEWLADSRAMRDRVPYLRMVDGRNVLKTVIVDDALMQEARRFRQVWHSLQELGGIHNSHAERLLERERKSWEEQHRREAEADTRPAAPAKAPAPTPAGEAPAPAAATAEPRTATAATAPEEKPSDEPYIETPRCTTCEECVQINSRMFAYDANKQAYIADLDAGTYRQLVEAAEACQVSIIHPGKPRNSAEAGLEELLERAEAFR
jgi:hypothetical protein